MTKIYTVANNSVSFEEVDGIRFSTLLEFVKNMSLDTDFDPMIESYLITLDPYQLQKDTWYALQNRIDNIRSVTSEITGTFETFDEDGETVVTRTEVTQEARELTEVEELTIQNLILQRNKIEAELPFLSSWREEEENDIVESIEDDIEPNEYNSEPTVIEDNYSYNVSQWKLDNYDKLRKAAYGSWENQLEMQADGTWEQHINDVKNKFPKQV